MLARCLPVMGIALALSGSVAHAQHHGYGGGVVGHYPGPTTRYEWNTHRPYGANYGGNYGGGGFYAGGAGVGIGFGVPYGANYYGPYVGYGGPVIVAPFGYYDGLSAYPPSTAGYGYVPRPIFTPPPVPVPPPLPIDPTEDLAARLQNPPRERMPVSTQDRLPVLKPSTPEAQQRSLRHMATGDQQIRMAHYAGAALEYRRAISDAEDIPDNYFRLGYAMAAQRRYDEAVQQWKYGLTLDPSWPTRGESLSALFGENNNLEKTSLVHRVADFVRLDPRDPNRIFLLAVLLYFDGDRDNAKQLFESAQRVTGNEPWLTAFLSTQGSTSATPAAPPANLKPDPTAAPLSSPDDTVPAPPPANITRPRTITPPASLNPDEPQSIPQRKDAPAKDKAPELLPPEKLPDVQSPPLPTSSKT